MDEIFNKNNIRTKNDSETIQKAIQMILKENKNYLHIITNQIAIYFL
jgi:hypothetical protein